LQICQELVRVFTATNIPLSKLDHPLLRDFLQQKVINGGAIPRSHQLQEAYLPDVYAAEKEKLTNMLCGKNICVIFDEMSDHEGRFVLNILFSPMEKDETGQILSYLADTVFLEKTNHSTVSQAVLKAIQDYGIDFENVVSFDTDNASYMKTAYNTVFKSLFPNAIHVTCLAHIQNLIGESFRKPFKLLNSFMKKMTHMFFHAGARNARYLAYMKSHVEGDVRVTFPPDPVATRWNSWFRSAQYHLKYFHYYSGFISEELTVCSQPPQSLQDLSGFLGNEQTKLSILVCLQFIVAKCQRIWDCLDLFLSRQPVTLKCFEILEDLMIYFSVNQQFTLETCIDYFDQAEDLNLQDRRSLLSSFGEAFELASEKLTKYLTPEGQPGIEFLKACRVFNPARVTIIPHGQANYLAIPGFSEVPAEEFKKYTDYIVPEAVQGSIPVNIDLFWQSTVDSLPTLSKLAIRYKNAVTNSADAEQSFSLYNLIVQGRRRSLSPKNIKSLVFLYYNQRVLSCVKDKGPSTVYELLNAEFDL